MNLRAFPKTNSIFLYWGPAVSATIYRKEGVGGEWGTLASNVKKGYYDDSSAVSGVIYYYKVTISNQSAEAGPATLLKDNPVYCSVIESVPVNGNTVQNMARIWKKESGDIIEPTDVARIFYHSIETYDGRPVTDGIKKVEEGEVVELNPAECLTNGLMLPNIWQFDDIGFNFSHTPPPTGYEKPAYSYLVAMFDGTILSLIFGHR